MLLFQLAGQVGEHSTRNLVYQSLDIHAHVLRVQKSILQAFVAVRTEVIRNLLQKCHVQSGIIRRTLEGLNHNLCRGLGGSQSERGNRSINNIHTCLYRLQIGHGSHAGGIVCVQLDGKACGLFQSLDQLCCLVGHQKAGHILDADGICPHLLNGFCLGSPVLQCVGISQGIGQGYLRLRALLLLRGIYAGLQVSQIVHAVENTDDVNPVGNGLLNKILYDIVGIRLIPQNILAAEQHLKLCVLEAVP